MLCNNKFKFVADTNHIMCGIAGIISSNPNNITSKTLKAMTDVIAHRGPDGDGQWISSSGKVGLAHRRLSIIDLTDAGKQPMHYLDRYTITFNGEIYNYLEIREDLKKQGYQFRSSCDTEVLMALYDFAKEKCLQYLDGMFSFAIWDEKEQELFCARDRFGEKPFYYHYEKGKCFLFASEMKQLWAAGIEKEADNIMLYNYIQFNFLTNPEDQTQTFYNGIKSLEHAHYLKISINNLELTTTRYWDIDALNENSSLTFKQASDQFSELFYDSVKKRLRSDVPVGSSLSGGLDSSLIVCVINELNKENKYHQKTFSAQFPGFEKDESRYQQIVNEKVKSEAFFTRPTENKFVTDFAKICYHQEEPFGSASIMAQYEVFKLAKANNVTVLLDGQGADEILAGYHGYYQHFFSELRHNHKEHDEQWRAYKALHVNNSVNVGINKNIKYFVKSNLPLLVEKVRKVKANYGIKNEILNADFFNENKKHAFHKKTNFPSLNSVLKHYTMGGELQELLRYADRNSMSQSLEVRLPFLNHQLVELMFTLPATYKINNGWTKFLLRKSFENIVPKDIIWRVDKIGYEPPQKRWVQNPDILKMISSSKQKLETSNILSKKAESKTFETKAANSAKDYNWNILMSGQLL